MASHYTRLLSSYDHRRVRMAAKKKASKKKAGKKKAGKRKGAKRKKA